VEDARPYKEVGISASYQRFRIAPFALVIADFTQLQKIFEGFAELPPKRHTSSSAQPLRVARVAFVQACSAAAARRAAPTCSSFNPEPAGRCPPSAGCSKRTRRGHSACSTRFPVDAAERSRWVAVLTCFDRHTKPVQTGSRTAISQTYERRCSRPPDDDRRSVDDARGAGQHLYGCWRQRGEGGLGWERMASLTRGSTSALCRALSCRYLMALDVDALGPNEFGRECRMSPSGLWQFPLTGSGDINSGHAG
jgi:hypothetical protein